MRQPLIITRVFEFGGSNAHLKTLIKYFGADNVLLILEDSHQAGLLKNVDNENLVRFTIIDNLRPYAHLIYPSLLSNIKELAMLIRSLAKLFLFWLRGFSEIVINVVEPEKYLYLLWLPFIRVTYIVHSVPAERHTPFTTFTCNNALSNRKKIVTVSKANRDVICRSWQIAKKKTKYVQVVYNTVMEGNKDNLQSAADEGAHNMVLTMGHVAAYKNPLLWLTVARHITNAYKDVRFIWLGNGPLFSDLVAETSMDERIYFQGAVTEPQLYLKEATIYYQPSINETHGIAVLEAMHSGLPCIVSNTGGLPESITDNQNGFLVPPEDFNAHVDALVKLLDQPDLRNTFGHNGYLMYQQLFSFEKFKSGMDAIYNN